MGVKRDICTGVDMADLSMFEHYYKLADVLIEKVTKEKVTECASS
jgi:hypothetical protein